MDRNLNILAAAACCSLILATVVRNKLKTRRNRSVWTKKWLNRRNEGKGLLDMLNIELFYEDLKSYRNFLRLNEDQFAEILSKIEKDITKQDTIMRESVPAKSKLEVTLRFLATGETFKSLMYQTRIHDSTISRFIPEVCQSLVKNLKDIYLKVPQTTEEWVDIANEYNHLWQFPQCLGALDGRHIKFRAPASDGSYYFNYKKEHSIVLLALCDAKYKFTYVNIGVNGRISDSGVFHQSQLSTCMTTNALNFPKPKPLPGQDVSLPYVIIADDAFPLLPNSMKPYPQKDLSTHTRIFNYRLSRARRVIEHAFGMLANRFRVLLNPINLNAQKVELITLTCVILHNYLVTMNGISYAEWASEELNKTIQELPHIGQQGGNRSSTCARNIRNAYRDFFNSPIGSVHWQDEAVNNYNY